MISLAWAQPETSHTNKTKKNISGAQWGSHHFRHTTTHGERRLSDDGTEKRSRQEHHTAEAGQTMNGFHPSSQVVAWCVDINRYVISSGLK